MVAVAQARRRSIDDVILAQLALDGCGHAVILNKAMGDRSTLVADDMLYQASRTRLALDRDSAIGVDPEAHCSRHSRIPNDGPAYP